MAQLTIYVSDDIEKDLRRAAKRANKSLSAYVIDLARPTLTSKSRIKTFAATFGSWKGDFPEIDELPFEQRDDL